MRRAPPLSGLVPDPDAERAEPAEPEIASLTRQRLRGAVAAAPTQGSVRSSGS